MRRRLPTLTPRQYERITLIALAALALIVLTGAAVRLTGSGLGCPNWPKCGDGFVAPLETHAWIEYGNRIASFLVGVACLGAGLLAFRRRPFRRDIARLGLLLPLGVLAQGVLGGLTVIFDLRPGFVMGHFALSMVLLAAGVALFWRARTDRPEPPAPAEEPNDRRLVLATRALIPVGALAIFAGTVATAGGPHAGASATGETVPRLEWLALDELIKWHGRTGTLLGLTALGAWFLARRWGGGAALRRALTILCVLVASQGVVGLAQWQLQLPSELVWLHIVIATGAWVALLFAVAAAGPLRPKAAPPAEPLAPVERSSSPEPVLTRSG